MPRNLEIHTKVSARDFVRFIRAHHKEAREKGAMKEYGEIPPYLEISGLIHAGWRVPDDVEPTIILVRKGAPDVKATICHEMLHIFEDYLRLPPGTLEKENLEMQRRGGVYFD
jgi:hypothetical protein